MAKDVSEKDNAADILLDFFEGDKKDLGSEADNEAIEVFSACMFNDYIEKAHQVVEKYSTATNSEGITYQVLKISVGEGDQLNVFDIEQMTIKNMGKKTDFVCLENGCFITVIEDKIFRLHDEGDKRFYATDPVAFKSGRQATQHDLDTSLMFLGVSNMLDYLESTSPKLNIPKQDTKRPRKHIDPISKLAHKITSEELYKEGGALLDVASAAEKKQGKEVRTAVSISLDDDSGIKTSKPMTQYDMDVNSAVASLWNAGNRYVTVRQVSENLAGSTSGRSSNQISEVAESLDRQFKTVVYIDFEQEARGRELEFEGEKVTSFKMKGHMIEARGVEIETANGRKVEGYELLAAPVIYQHAAALKQVVSYPQRLLDTPGRNTPENIVIKNYLLRRIGQMKKSGNGTQSNRILYKTVFEKAGIKDPSRDKTRKIRNYARGCLDSWVEKKHIKGFKEITSETGREHSIRGIDIEI